MHSTAEAPTPGRASCLSGGSRAATHARLVVSQWHILKKRTSAILIDGASLDIATAAIVGKHKATATLTSDDAVRHRIEKSVRVLEEQLGQGATIYGVNTGYGGSADVRCEQHEVHTLQQSFLQHLNCGLLPVSPTGGLCDAVPSSLKQEWVRAAMLTRANSVARGHSAVRASTIEMLLKLLNHDIIPLIPARGSISASGDLSPLSYVAGVMEGNPGIHCWTGPAGNRRIVTAPEALQEAGFRPIVFKPKEALGLVNGTAVSAAAAGLTLSSLHNILALSQLLTAMNVEAVLGTATSFAPFISQVRPHPGQAQVASTILSALEGSKLATGLFERHDHSLFQDRYSLRTVPQWLGPFVEDLLLAHDQVTVELNSTTDNPLIDPATGDIYHGGNFQAVSVTTAMEKCRLAAQAIGRMLFSQFTELVNPATNRGLPPNLCADEPSISFTMKGVDTNMAAYMSELSFLANPVHNHVVCAEMGNQALNSLALISARYADSAVDILTIMCACTLYGVCQALDLRAMMQIFESRLQKSLHESIDFLQQALALKDLFALEAKEKVWAYVKTELGKTTTLDSKDRFGKIMAGAKAPLMEVVEALDEIPVGIVSHIKIWTRHSTAEAVELFETTRSEYLEKGDASELMGSASRRLYRFVREELKVPMHRGVVDHPTYGAPAANGNGNETAARWDDGWRKQTIGHWISVIHGAIKDDRIMDVVVECLKDGLEAEPEREHWLSGKGALNGA